MIETNALGVIERLSGSSDPQDFIPNLRIIKEVSRLDPENAEMWKDISRYAINYFGCDREGIIRLACPTKGFQTGTEYLVLDNSEGGIRTIRENTQDYNELLEKYFKDIPESSFGRFDILKFPFKDLVTRKIGDRQEMGNRINELLRYPADIDDWVNIHDQAGFVNPARVRNVRFSEEELRSGTQLDIMWNFVNGMQRGEPWINKTFWCEPVVVSGNTNAFSVVESHHRTLSAKLLGIPLIPAYFE